MTIIWCMVLETWSTTDMFCHSGLFFPFLPPMDPENQNQEKGKKTWRHYHFTNVYHKWQLYVVWCMFPEIWVATDIFCSFWAIFCPFIPLTTWNIKILKKMKKPPPGDIILLHRCNINDNHISYGFWDTKRDRKNFCHFGPLFALLPP